MTGRNRSQVVLSEGWTRDLGEVQRILEETAEDLGPPGKDRLYGSGRVDAYRAVRRLSAPSR